MAKKKDIVENGETTKIEKVSEEKVKKEDINVQPQIDMEALIKQITKQVREEVTKEFESKMVDTSVDKPIYKTNRRKKEEYNFDLTDKVPVKNVSFGGVGHIDTRGRAVIWNEFGDVVYMSIEDVLNMQSTNPVLLNEPKLMVEDEEIAQYLDKTEVYDAIEEINNLQDFFKKDIKYVEEIIGKLPEGYRKELANEVFIMNEAELIDSGILKRMLQRVLRIDLGLKTM